MNKRFLATLIALTMVIAAIFIAYIKDADNTDKVAAAENDETIDYMALVNKTNKLPDNWEDLIETVHVTNSVGDDVEVEKKAYEAYEKLRDDLKDEGIFLQLDSARRTVEAQQEIMDRYIEKYGADYAARTVAKPGYSEHHTGLALDLYFQIDGKDVYYNEDLVKYPEIWAKIHAKLADYGFILRYLDGQEHITGYAYEPWHIRYIDDVDAAREIMSKGITFEEYLGAVIPANLNVDIGTSKLFTKEELNAAVVQLKCHFAGYSGVQLTGIRYCGDSYVKDGKVRFVTDFHTSDNADKKFAPNRYYVDCQWGMTYDEKDGWQIVE